MPGKGPDLAQGAISFRQLERLRIEYEDQGVFCTAGQVFSVGGEFYAIDTVGMAFDGFAVLTKNWSTSR